MPFEPCAFVSICLMSKQYLGQAKSLKPQSFLNCLPWLYHCLKLSMLEKEHLMQLFYLYLKKKERKEKRKRKTFESSPLSVLLTLLSSSCRHRDEAHPAAGS